MQAEFSVELGREDERMELPWAAPGGEPRYYDLKRNPELLLNVQEAFDHRELGEFLARANSAISILQTAKCDIWASDEISEEEKIFGEPWKFGSYVDLIFQKPQPRLSLEAHEKIAQSLCDLLKRAPMMGCAAEFIIRHCYFHVEGKEDSEQGFGITFYLFGYGADEAQARSRWNIGMKLAENALLQLSAQQRRSEATSK
jgi:hypothetical protein